MKRRSEFMCPVCIANAALAFAGATSAGSVAALVVKLRGKKREEIHSEPKTKEK
jgi:hypothetical protein